MELQREALRAGVRTAQEEVHRVTLELRERAARVERLQNKYDILAARMKAGDGEQHSQAYYIIKAAQEREELQRTGDELDAAIVKADKEARRRCRVRLLSHWGGGISPILPLPMPHWEQPVEGAAPGLPSHAPRLLPLVRTARRGERKRL